MTGTLIYSSANTKLQKLAKRPEVAKWLDKRKVYSLDLLSGWTCPAAKLCMSKAMEVDDGRRTVKDGPHTQFRCFSASQEAQYTGVYNRRKHNTKIIKQATRGGSLSTCLAALEASFPADAGIIRQHVSGDFFNDTYFAAWLELARNHSDALFYAYTKQLPLWIKHRSFIPDNVVLTASRGGRYDNLIDTHGLRESVVIYYENEAKYEIDEDDSHAANPEWRNRSFNLLIHGTGPPGTRHSKAVQKQRESKAK